MGMVPAQGKNVGNYRLVAKLWDGTFGETWKGQTSQGDLVAVQFIQNDLLCQELPRISQKILSLSHPCIARLLTIEKEPHALVWEYMAGRRVDTYIKQLKTIKSHIAVYIARKILEILMTTASDGIVHGGLRPTRVAVTPEKRVILTNFGVGPLEQRIVSKLYSQGDNETLKKFSSILPYFPPEVLEDQVLDDPKNDIYTVGLLLLEMLTGKRVTRDKIPETLHEHEITDRLCFVVLKAVADFEERYNHPNEMYQELSQYLKSSDDVEKIYVPPPNNAVKNIALEAIPADSEEYRVYQADMIAAKQTIEAEVVAAEPADIAEEKEQMDSHSHESPKRESVKTVAPSLKKTIRLNADALLLISTIDKKILDPLEKDPVYPHIFWKFFAASLLVLGFICTIAWFFPGVSTESPSSSKLFLSPFYPTPPHWLLSPFYAMQGWPIVLKIVGHVLIWGLLSFFFLLPFLDAEGRIRQKPMVMAFVTLLLGVLVAFIVLGSIL